MVSLAYFLVVLSVFSAVAIADEVKSGQTESVDEKWFGRGWGGLGYNRFLGSGMYGCGWGSTSWPWLGRYGGFSVYGMFPYYNSLWFKEVDGASSVARRSAIIDADQIFQRRDESTVGCKNAQGQVDHFVSADCHQAVKSLVSKKASSANCKSCAVKLVTPTGQLAAAGAPVEALQKVADKMLKSCAEGSSSNHARRSPEETSNSGTSKQQFAMIFQKGDGQSCDN